jgi:hypothetical protein
MLTVLSDRGVVQYLRIAVEVAAFEPGAPHADAHPSNVRLTSSSATAPTMMTMALPSELSPMSSF